MKKTTALWLGLSALGLSTSVALADNNLYGDSGIRYQYDLSDPGDRVEYSIDIDAQIRDSINVDPGRSIDRLIGQYGGGAYDD